MTHLACGAQISRAIGSQSRRHVCQSAMSRSHQASLLSCWQHGRLEKVNAILQKLCPCTGTAVDSNQVCRGRCAYAGTFLPGDSLSVCAAGVVHLVPGLDNMCSKCSSHWARQDPVSAGWVAARGRLYGLSGCIAATVYHRQCSNRWDTPHLCLPGRWHERSLAWSSAQP